MDQSSRAYIDSVTVTLSAAAYATIYYTTDGSDPATRSRLSTPHRSALSTTTTLKAIAAHPDYAESAVASNTYTIKVAAPVFRRGSGHRAGSGRRGLDQTLRRHHSLHAQRHGPHSVGSRDCIGVEAAAWKFHPQGAGHPAGARQAT